MRDRFRIGRVLSACVLVVATVAVYATEWLAFLWPVMALVDAGAALGVVRRRRRTPV